MEKKCFECDSPATIEHHVVPQSRGGTKTVSLCDECHSLVHDAKLISLSNLVMTGKKITRNIKVIEAVVAMYERGLSKSKIAREIGINRKTVYAILEECGLHENTGSGCEIKVTQDVMQEIQKLRKKQYTWGEIAQKVGISQTHMDRLIKKHNWSDGVYGGRNAQRVSYRKMDEEDVGKAKSLRKQGWAMTKIAQEFKVNRHTLYNHGIHK